MDEFIKVLTIIGQIGTFIGVIFVVYKSFNKPQQQDEQDIALLKSACLMRHAGIDADIHDIKVNHLSHIEEDVKNLQLGQTRIFTILDERLPGPNKQYEKTTSSPAQ